MNDAVIMQVLYTKSHLVSDLTDSLLTEVEAAGLHIVEEISSGHELEHYIIILIVLEDIDKIDNVWMLAHLEYFNLAPLLEHLYMCHVLFLDLLDSYLPASLLVDSQFH